MDNLETEQERGITMKSSAVTLIHTDKQDDTYLINLIDSPGHIDFSSEVSTATRLCDSAIIVVDVVEGVCPQTRTVLKQAYEEGLTLVLLINKIDRLIIELQLTPEQAFETINRLIEQVNSIIAEFFTSDVTKIDFDQHQETNSDFHLDEEQSEKMHSWSTGLELTNDSDLYFHPELGEVIFSCAIDNWGFRICDFARMWSQKLNIPEDIVTKALWGDYYLAPPSGKTDALKSIKLGAKRKGKPNLFVQCILNQLWNLYETFTVKKEVDKFQSIAANLKVQVSGKDAREKDAGTLLRILLSSWLPLGPCCLDGLVQCCPSPNRAMSKYRAMHMLYGDQVANYRAEEYIEDKASSCKSDALLTPICQSIMKCSSADDAPFVAFVSKVFWIEKSKFFRAEATPSSTQEAPTEPMTTQNPFASAEFVALARIFSGACYVGRRVFVLGPKFDGSRLPDEVLDLNPNDLPLGPLKLPSSSFSDSDDNQSITSNLSRSRIPSCSGSYSGPGLLLRQRNDSVSDTGSVTGYFGTSPGSTTSNSWFHQATARHEFHSSSAVRHVYVADIAGVVRFLGGQNDILKVSAGELVLAGSVVGLLGGDLITSLPKSGLIVSSLRLVSNKPNHETVNSGVVPLAGLTVWHGAPLLSVSLEPGLTTNPDDIVRLERGLKLLERSDPCAEVTVTQKGEYLLHASGELHLQKCLDDFHKYFAPKLQVQVSSFCVPYRETITEAATPIDPSLDLDLYSEDNRIQAEERLSHFMRQLNLLNADDLDENKSVLHKYRNKILNLGPLCRNYR
ncbi:Elongation factor-like GTPase 1 [Cichlidogyrus casuarinus]|uniref:Elongation factor-like GTPase 1 n=1 Tax=Cichlidogyrus casuarinus TaxID=1844966 RepID=A0ABD2PQJ4_9PLAT